jgi:ABC-type transport system involved in multi-copper enzyme maturation permease subunit
MSNWSLSWRGLRTVVELELRQRVRSNRWVWALVGWFVLVGGLTTLVIWAVSRAYEYSREAGGTPASGGPMAFGMITYLVLGLGLMIAPAFTSTSINGDRTAGTLATLQATRLSAVELALGRLISAWLVAAVFLVVALPFIGWSMVLGSISVWQVLVTFAVVFAEVAVVCAIGLGFSAIISRAAMSAMLTYITVVILSAITVIVMLLSTVLVQREEPIQVWGLPPAVEQEYQDQVNKAVERDSDAEIPAPPVDKCTWYTRIDKVTRTDLVWWILVANPFVVTADAAPLPPGAATDLNKYVNDSGDPLAGVRAGVRFLSLSPVTAQDQCSELYNLSGFETKVAPDGTATVVNNKGEVVYTSPVKRQIITADHPVWPWGLGFHFVLGGLFFWVAVRRLSVPAGVLPKGTRVA